MPSVVSGPTAFPLLQGPVTQVLPGRLSRPRPVAAFPAALDYSELLGGCHHCEPKAIGLFSKLLSGWNLVRPEYTGCLSCLEFKSMWLLPLTV